MRDSDTETRHLQAAAVHQAIAGLNDVGGALEEIEKGAAVLADTGWLEVDELQLRGLDVVPAAGQVGVLIRALPIGLAFPGDRPRLRRAAYRCAQQSRVDELVAITAIAVALLSADLLSHDAETAAIRVRQSLLEDAPTALLESLTSRGEAAPSFNDSPIAVLATALWGLRAAAEQPLEQLLQELAPAPATTRVLATAWWAEQHHQDVSVQPADLEFAATIGRSAQLPMPATG